MKGRIPAMAVVPIVVVLLSFLMISVNETPVPRDVEKELPPWFGGAFVPAAGLQTQPATEQPISQQPTGEQQSATTEATAEQPTTQTEVPEGFVLFEENIVEIEEKEYKLTPSEIVVRPGKVTFVLHNVGKFSHNFNIEGQGVDVTARKFGPGKTVTLEVELAEGEYRISCPLSNHDDRGMLGTLLVTR